MKICIRSYIRIILFLVSLLNSFNSKAQTRDSLWSSLKNRNIDSSITFYSHKTEQMFKAEFRPVNKDTIIIREYKNAADGFSLNSFNLSHLSSSIWIQYLNDSTWYIYGNRVEFAFYPFIYRTKDAGLSWETVMQSWPKVSFNPKMTSRFHVYDMNRGIWLTGLHKNKVTYRITEDGGFTWQEKRFRIKRIYAGRGINTFVRLLIKGDSTKILLDNRSGFGREWTKLPDVNTYESVDFGRTFKKVKSRK